MPRTSLNTATAHQSGDGNPLAALEAAVNRYYPNLLSTVRACLSVFGAMALKGRTKPLSLIFETTSGFGKTAALQMTFPLPNADWGPVVYRSDKFTPKAFVTHAANVKADELAKMDLLPKLKDKVLVTKELAPIFRGREEELKENFSTLISVLDGKGFTSDTGMRGRRGYEGDYLFNWIGATTPIPAATHRLMSQLGTRLLFFEVPSMQPTEADLLRYAQSDDAGEAEAVCQTALNNLLRAFFSAHGIGTVNPKDMPFSKPLLKRLVRWATFLVAARAEVRSEKIDSDWQPVAATPAEGPFKVVNYLKELARGHALIHGRMEVGEADIALVGRVAISSMPAHLRPIVRELQTKPSVDSSRCAALCRVSAPTARRYLKEVTLLGICELTKGTAATNAPDTVRLAPAFGWLCQNLEH